MNKKQLANSPCCETWWADSVLLSWTRLCWTSSHEGMNTGGCHNYSIQQSSAFQPNLVPATGKWVQWRKLCDVMGTQLSANGSWAELSVTEGHSNQSVSLLAPAVSRSGLLMNNCSSSPSLWCISRIALTPAFALLKTVGTNKTPWITCTMPGPFTTSLSCSKMKPYVQ